MVRPLAEVFAELSASRQTQGKWHDLGTRLTMIFLGILSGDKAFVG
jgi:hypothetical protein